MNNLLSILYNKGFIKKNGKIDFNLIVSDLRLNGYVISHHSLRSWLNGNRRMTSSNLSMMSRFLGLTMDETYTAVMKYKTEYKEVN